MLEKERQADGCEVQLQAMSAGQFGSPACRAPLGRAAATRSRQARLV